MHNNTSTCTIHKSTEDVDGLENYFMAKSQREKSDLEYFGAACRSQLDSVQLWHPHIGVALINMFCIQYVYKPLRNGV